MKKLLLIILLLFTTLKIFSQSQGISYQAVIIDQNSEEIPGTDVSGNILPNKAIKVRFTILDAAGTIDYQEKQSTVTDAYGTINLTIGRGIPTCASPKAFTEIDWNGTPKNLKVDISVSQSNVFYTDFSNQELTFIPYAYHKNITATGTLKVDGKSTLQDLSVEATTNLNGNLDVNNNSPTHLSGTLSVEQNTILDSTLIVNSSSNLNGQVVINAGISGSDQLTSSYPLLVTGSNQGISIKINGKRSNSTNYVTFWDDEGPQGRIEGESTDDIYSDPMYYFENAKLIVDAGVAAANLAAAYSASTVCVGLGTCVTAPPPSKIAFGIAQLVVKTAQIAQYNYYRVENAGVVYKSKGADYAEYLPKLNPDEKFYPGEIIGVKDGFITHSTTDADKIMVVSQRPIVLGNMPKPGYEDQFEKIAFIGQVETKIVGKVNAGDYILPSRKNDGTGIAIAPADIQPSDFLKVAGVAWNNSQSGTGYVNVAVGLHSNDAALFSIRQEKKIQELEQEIKNLKEQLNHMNAALAQLVPGYSKLLNGSSDSETSLQSDSSSSNKQQKLMSTNQDNVYPSQNMIVYFDINKENVIQGIEMAKKILSGQSTQDTVQSTTSALVNSAPLSGNGTHDQDKSLEKKYILFQKLDNPVFKEEFINELLSSVKTKMNEYYKKDVQSGATVIKNY